MSIKITPRGNRILALPIAPPEKSASGAIWLLTGKDRHSVRFDVKRFRVVAPEQGRQNPETGDWFRTTSLEPGDIIRTGMYPGASVPEVKIDGDVAWFIPVENVICQEVE